MWLVLDSYVQAEIFNVYKYKYTLMYLYLCLVQFSVNLSACRLVHNVCHCVLLATLVQTHCKRKQ